MIAEAKYLKTRLRLAESLLEKSYKRLKKARKCDEGLEQAVEMYFLARDTFAHMLDEMSINEQELRIRERLRSAGPDERWDICCDSAPGTLDGIGLIERLMDFARKLPGGMNGR